MCAASITRRGLRCYEHALDADPLTDAFYRKPMSCYAKLGRRDEARDSALPHPAARVFPAITPRSTSNNV